MLHALTERPASRRRQTASMRAMGASMALVGLFLGWQGATSVALATAILRAIGALASRAWPRLLRVPSTGHVLAATLIHLLTWRWQESLLLWPGPHTSLLALAGICLAGAIAVRLARGRSPERGGAAAQKPPS
jgi:hypothetical protein